MKRTIMLSLVLGGFSVPALAADDDTGFYGSLRLGQQSTKNIEGVFFAPAGDFTTGEGEGDEGEMGPAAESVPEGSDTIGGRFRTKSAFQIGAELGYDFGMIRAGVELAYGRNKVRGFDVASLNGSPVTEVSDLDAFLFCDYISDGEADEDSCSADGTMIVGPGGTFAKVRQLSAIASVWVDIPTGLPIEPYVGGGFGLSGYHVKIPGDSDGKARFAWHLGGGAAYKFSSAIALTLDYRYRQVKGGTLFEEGDYGVVLGKLKTHSYGAALRFTF